MRHRADPWTRADNLRPRQGDERPRDARGFPLDPPPRQVGPIVTPPPDPPQIARETTLVTVPADRGVVLLARPWEAVHGVTVRNDTTGALYLSTGAATDVSPSAYNWLLGPGETMELGAERSAIVAVAEAGGAVAVTVAVPAPPAT